MGVVYEKNLSWDGDIKIARELQYPKKVIEMLKKQPDPEARQRILYDARKGVYDN